MVCWIALGTTDLLLRCGGLTQGALAIQDVHSTFDLKFGLQLREVGCEATQIWLSDGF